MRTKSEEKDGQQRNASGTSAISGITWNMDTAQNEMNEQDRFSSEVVRDKEQFNFLRDE